MEISLSALCPQHLDRQALHQPPGQSAGTKAGTVPKTVSTSWQQSGVYLSHMVLPPLPRAKVGAAGHGRRRVEKRRRPPDRGKAIEGPQLPAAERGAH